MSNDKMTENSGESCWPEQEAVWSWMKANGITLTFQQEHDLKCSATHHRLEIQRERDDLRVEVEALKAKLATAGADALDRAAELLIKGGAEIPIHEEGTIESAHKSGLSCALVVIHGESDRLRRECE